MDPLDAVLIVPLLLEEVVVEEVEEAVVQVAAAVELGTMIEEVI